MGGRAELQVHIYFLRVLALLVLLVQVKMAQYSD